MSNPFAWTSRGSAYRTASFVSACVVEPTSTSPGSAAVCSRAAAFTTEPVTNICPDGPMPVAASPDSMPTLIRQLLVQSELVAEAYDAVADSESGAHGAHGVVLVDLRQPEHGHDRVADELLHLAAERLKLLGGRGVEAAEDLAGALGVQALREPRRIDESAKRTVTTLRSSVSSEVATRAPQFGQNRASSGSGWPQTAHVMHPA